MTDAADAVPARPPADLDLVVGSVLGVAGVAGLHGGAFGQVATHLPGRSVTGIRLAPERAEVHLVVDTGVDIPAVADAVRRAVRAVVPAPVDVYVEDVAAPTYDVAAAVDDRAARQQPLTSDPDDV